MAGKTGHALCCHAGGNRQADRLCLFKRDRRTDVTPKGKREKPSLREMEQQIRRDMEDGIDSKGKKITLCQLYAKQNAQRANVKKKIGRAHV